jgi:hypothetical protein
MYAQLTILLPRPLLHFWFYFIHSFILLRYVNINKTIAVIFLFFFFSFETNKVTKITTQSEGVTEQSTEEEISSYERWITDWRMLHNVDLHNLYFSSDIIKGKVVPVL